MVAQDKIKVYCINKVRNSRGVINEYVIRDQSGNACSLKRSDMAKMLKNKQYEVVNLQLDSLGRIVDKAVTEEKEQLNEAEMALIQGINLVNHMNDMNYMNKLQAASMSLLSKGYKFTHIYSRRLGNTKFNYIIFYGGDSSEKTDREIYVTIERMIKSYGTVNEAVQDLEMKDTRFGIVDLLDDAIIHAFGDEEKIQSYIRQQIKQSDCSDSTSLLNYIFRDIDNNRLYGYGNFKRKRDYNEFNNQFKKVMKQDGVSNRSSSKSITEQNVLNLAYQAGRTARKVRRVSRLLDMFSR